MAARAGVLRNVARRVSVTSRATQATRTSLPSMALGVAATQSRRASGAAAGSSGEKCGARARMRGGAVFPSAAALSTTTTRGVRGRRKTGGGGSLSGRRSSEYRVADKSTGKWPFVSTDALPNREVANFRSDDTERSGRSRGSDDDDDDDDDDEDDDDEIEGPIVFMDELREHLRTQGFVTEEDTDEVGVPESDGNDDTEDNDDEYIADDLGSYAAQRVPVHGVQGDYFLDLSEESPLPDDDPPGHRSGYVCILGPPNAGKSTLMNALVGSKLAIVTSKPQTTRHKILGILSRDTYQMILMDTPGIMRDQRHKLDKRMMGSVRHARGDAEVMLGIFDVGRSPIRMYESLAINAGDLPYAIILNKSDTLRNKGDLEAVKRWFEENTPAHKVFVVSAKLGSGIEEVCDWAASQLPLGPSLYPKEQLSEHPERFFVTEILREKIFLNYGQEIPYCSQVNVVEYIERNGVRKDGTRMKDYVAIDIIVETLGQKKIVVGAKGMEIKKVALAARKDMEKFLGREVYLDIKVKSRKGWRNDEAFLNEYGYNLKTDM